MLLVSKGRGISPPAPALLALCSPELPNQLWHSANAPAEGNNLYFSALLGSAGLLSFVSSRKNQAAGKGNGKGGNIKYRHFIIQHAEQGI